MNGFYNKTCLIIGMGISGQACSRYLLQKGARLLCVDRNASKMQASGYPVHSDESPVNMDAIDFCVPSPGIPPQHPLVEEAKKRKIPITSELEMALSDERLRHKWIAGVTGSNGKTTTVLMAEYALQAAGKKAIAAGNLGIPLLSLVEAPYDYFVVEVSSFQLDLLPIRPFFNAVFILNVTENHLDRYSSFQAYAASKLRILHCAKPGGSCWIDKSSYENWPSLQHGSVSLLESIDKGTSEKYGLAGVSHQLSSQFGQTVVSNAEENPEGRVNLTLPRDALKADDETDGQSDRMVDEKSGLAPHDRLNRNAALALCREAGLTEDQFFQSLDTFKKPPHRIEFVEQIGGVAYIDDSKATSIDAVLKAVLSLTGSIILIAGGVDKGGDFRKWIPVFEKKVRQMFVIGEAAGRMYKELSNSIPVDKAPTLEAAFFKSAALAKPKETILLSPGCSSFDQFENYQHRGEVFKKLVLQLKEHQS